MTDNNAPTDAAATTARGLAKANEIYRGDWDADGTTAVYLPDAIAQQLSPSSASWQRSASRRACPPRWPTQRRSCARSANPRSPIGFSERKSIDACSTMRRCY